MVYLRQRLARYIRERRGKIPQRVFARKIGVAQSTIMRIENEDQNVTLSTLEALCQVFHADIAELFPPLETTRVYSSGVPLGLGVPERGSAATVHDEPAEHKTSTGKRGRKKTPSPARK
ncbi:MAG: helix-turn-helix transcriptional regulator [Gammaproteobacteria bacterium]